MSQAAGGWTVQTNPAAGTSLLGVSDPSTTICFAVATPLAAPEGYWAYFPSATTVTLPTVAAQATTLVLPPGHYTMVGDPFDGPAVLTGADAVSTYSASTGYESTTTLQPGQGAWVLSRGGGTLTISPQ